MGTGEGAQTLTTRQGHPVTDNQNVRTVGSRGPTTLENYQFLEKITHFDRERIPERVVHARGAGAHGTFEAYGTVGKDSVSKYTRAKLFFNKKENKHPYLSASLRLFMVVIRLKHCGIQEVLPPSFIRKMATGFSRKQSESIFERTNDFKQAGERYRMHEDWERDDLILNLVNTLKPCQKHIQDKMVELFTKCDPDYGKRVAEGLNQASDSMQKGPIGSTSTQDAVKQAIKANPY